MLPYLRGEVSKRSYGRWIFNCRNRHSLLTLTSVVSLVITCFVFLRYVSPSSEDFENESYPEDFPTNPDSEIIRILGEDTHRLQFIKQMMKDAWDDYCNYAWPQNELDPVGETGVPGDALGSANLAVTIIDSLDTLHIMGLTEEYKKARDYVATMNFKNIDGEVSLFELNIRIVGGLLGAYAVSNDKMFLTKCYELTTRLLPAFTKDSGLPHSSINIKTKTPSSNSQVVLAELGSLHLEFMYLSELTGDSRFRDKVMKIRKTMKAAYKDKGLYSSNIDIETGNATSQRVTMGAMSDSFYEYLLKASIQYNDTEAREMYDQAMDAFIRNDLIRVSQQSHLLYIAELDNGMVRNKVDHLACFAGGMFALGAYVDPKNENAARDFEIGRNFTNTCHESYIRTATRIGPEEFYFDYRAEATSTGLSHYILRPEVIESYFYLYRITGDSIYRDWAWDAAQAIQHYTKVGPGRGYAGIRNVNNKNPDKDSLMQSFFLAETLKYLYLIFAPSNVISIDKWVFNTEAHPFPIYDKPAVPVPS